MTDHTAPLPSPQGRPGFSLLRVRAIARRHTYVLRRSPHRLFDITIWPLVDVLLFGSIGAFVAQSTTGPSTAFGYLLAGIILWHVVYQSQIAVSTGFLEEAWSRNMLNLMVTPLKETEYVVGVAAFGMVKLVLGVGLTALCAAVAYAFNLGALGFGLVPIAAVLLAVGWAIALFVIGIVLRFGSGAEALAWGILFAVMPLSGVFYPVDALPVLLRPVALALPTTHAFEAMRALVDGRPLPWSEIGIAAAAALVLAVAALLFVTRMLATFRRRGYISRYS
jgi:ABC-2 type transport system permease protein